MSTFADAWHSHFGDTRPEGHSLREAYPERWLRIHSLPEGRRYPETTKDRAILLARHHAVAAAIVGEDLAWLVALSWDPTEALAPAHPLFPWIGPARPAGMWGPADHDDDLPDLSVFAMLVQWRAADFDAALMEVAEDRSSFLLMNAETGAVWAPYDGGADLIFPHEWERDRAAIQFSSWTSPRSDGL
ncbi:MAG: hypothetical protein IPK85_04645 [Gemmatimonadetes bacterium]|nr:hypothetical protein [Gemmatimonadota bacterium]